jgi:hypothetical protein
VEKLQPAPICSQDSHLLLTQAPLIYLFFFMLELYTPEQVMRQLVSTRSADGHFGTPAWNFILMFNVVSAKYYHLLHWPCTIVFRLFKKVIDHVPVASHKVFL